MPGESTYVNTQTARKLTRDLMLSAARLKGFETDLHLEGQQFATLLSILYVGVSHRFFAFSSTKTELAN